MTDLIPRAYLYAAAALAIALAVAGGALALHHYGATRYDAGVTDGRNAVIAEDAGRAAQAQAAQNWLATYAAAAGGRMQHSLATALPTIEANTHASVEHIRTIYRDRPVPADRCQRPDGVQRELDAAVDAANAAAAPGSDLRPRTPVAPAPARSAPAVGR